MKYLILLLLLSSTSAFAQKDEVFQLSTKVARTTKFASGWIALDSGWKFQAGDDPDWKKPGFNDSTWQSINLLKDLYDLPQIPKRGVIWFRIKLKTDSTFLDRELVMRIYQTGASEIYLEGTRIHQLGNVSADPDAVKFYSPNSTSLSFPIAHGTEQTLAIRFANLPANYPVYSFSPKSRLEVWISTLGNANNDQMIRYYRTYNDRMNIGIGVASILCILYLSFYFFFPSQRINLYFGLSNLFFALFLIFNMITTDYHGDVFKLLIPSVVFTVLYLLLFLYCIYKIFNQPIGWVFKALSVGAIIAVPAVFLFDIGLISICIAVLVLVDTLRVSIRSLRTNKTGGLIILAGVAIGLIYWSLNLLSGIGLINVPGIDSYSSLALLIAPLNLAIYLGYSYGKTSQSLRQKLTEVEQLSHEKEEILSTQNEMLEAQVTERTSALKESLENLKSAQSRLIQSEKMASLGELTAGIAHEIQNPLNFVMNFSEVNNELIEEMNEEINKGRTDEVRLISSDIKQNLEKINYHGKRADAIVKGMLQHTRKTKGVKEPTAINALADEYLRLSYHGLRAKDKSFNATIKTDFDESIGNINIIPQDIGRVILNLINNAFYAVGEMKKQHPEEYEPTVSISTKKDSNKIAISVKDNGTGIPQKIADKIFQPFFTTKPAGQGTGLGLSLAYDIVKAHGGELRVETKQGVGSEFIIELPLE